jgi:ubiquinone/menaquinone biosynthesis C-methylase UbiE
MGTAQTQGRLWGARAHDWSDLQEPAWRTVFLKFLSLAGVGSGINYLDVGCGAGGALLLAAEAGARVSGLDASEALVAVARRRLPDARIEVGEMEQLPFADGEFDVVSGINAFQFAEDPTFALREAGRVCRPGGTIAVLSWGEPVSCQLLTLSQSALTPLLPAPSQPPPAAAVPFGRKGVIEEKMQSAGLAVVNAGAFEAALIYGNLDVAIRAISSSGLANRAAGHAGSDAVTRALSGALADHLDANGRVSLNNQFRWVTAAPDGR